MRNREEHVKLCSVASLIETSLGLSLLSRHDCSTIILNDEDRRIAAEAPAYAIASLLREAIDLLNELM